MTITGQLRYGPGEARVDYTLVAVRNGLPEQYAAAKTVLVNRGFHEGQRVTVIGTIAGPVIYMDDAEPA